MLVENSAICGKCLDIVISKNPYQTSTCSCGAVTVSGGLENPKIEGEDYIDTRWEMKDCIVKDCVKSIGGATERTEIVMAVLAALRRAERVIADGELSVVATKDNQYMIYDGENYFITKGDSDGKKLG